MRDGRMHQTTVRFSPDLWGAVELECSRLGVSAAQYVREAALARLAYTAGHRGNQDYDHALSHAGAPRPETAEAHLAQHEASEQLLAAAAVSAQSAHVRERSRVVREQATEIRRMRRGLER